MELRIEGYDTRDTVPRWEVVWRNTLRMRCVTSNTGRIIYARNIGGQPLAIEWPSIISR